MYVKLAIKTRLLSYKNKRLTIKNKQPLRTFGDWSEFLSSGGKIYFYNSKTEKAQWEKPDEWDWLVSQEYEQVFLFTFLVICSNCSVVVERRIPKTTTRLRRRPKTIEAVEEATIVRRVDIEAINMTMTLRMIVQPGIRSKLMAVEVAVVMNTRAILEVH